MCKEGKIPSIDLPYYQKIPNMMQSKKGACSSNTQTAKANCLVHDRRNAGTEKVPEYVNKKRSHLNRTVYEDETIRGRKSIVPLVRAAEKLYTEKTGQKCQRSFAPYREAVLHIKEGITDGQLLDFKTSVERETGWRVLGIWLHEDEGHAKSKYIDGDDGFAINHHAHVLFGCQDLNTGKAIRADRKKLSRMQDLLAAATGMERGNRAAETGRRHRSAMAQRIYSQGQRIEALEEDIETKEIILANAEAAIDAAKEEGAKVKQQAAIDAANIKKRALDEKKMIINGAWAEDKRIRQHAEEAQRLWNEKRAAAKAEIDAIKLNKARKEAAVASVKAASERVKGIFGQSSKDKEINALKAQINALKAELSKVPKQVQQAVAQERKRETANYNSLFAMAKRQGYVEVNKPIDPQNVASAIQELLDENKMYREWVEEYRYEEKERQRNQGQGRSRGR